MTTTSLKTLSILAAGLCLASAAMASSIFTVPDGLAPGDQYRLVFVTADLYTAASTDIADYNTEVNTEANSNSDLAALGTTWTVVGATVAVNAQTNIGIDPGVPIYNLGDQLVANDASKGCGALFGGGTGCFWNNTIAYDENGSLVHSFVWTGELQSDAANGGFSALGTGIGTLRLNTYQIFGGTIFEEDPLPPGTTMLPLFAISDVLTVPGGQGAVPEPATAWLGLAGVSLLTLRRRLFPR